MIRVPRTKVSQTWWVNSPKSHAGHMQGTAWWTGWIFQDFLFLIQQTYPLWLVLFFLGMIIMRTMIIFSSKTQRHEIMHSGSQEYDEQKLLHANAACSPKNTEERHNFQKGHPRSSQDQFPNYRIPLSKLYMIRDIQKKKNPLTHRFKHKIWFLRHQNLSKSQNCLDPIEIYKIPYPLQLLKQFLILSH